MQAATRREKEEKTRCEWDRDRTEIRTVVLQEFIEDDDGNLKRNTKLEYQSLRAATNTYNVMSILVICVNRVLISGI